MTREDVTLQEVARSTWWGWGDPALSTPLPAAAKKHIRRLFGQTCGRKPVPLSSLEMPPNRLPETAMTALREALGSDNVVDDPLSRMQHAGGKSYVDLMRARSGDTSKAPDAVLFPATTAEISAVFDLADEHSFVVIPYGGGTSVVAGLSPERETCEPPRPVISLDMRRMRGLLELDEVSGTARFGAGTRAVDAERALRARGWTLGHFPQSYQQASIGGFVATRSAGQSSSGYGRIDDLVVAVEAVAPAGELNFGDRSPASAAGPRLLDTIVGSEGAFAVITNVTLQVQRVRPVKAHLAVSLPTFADAAEALRRLVQELGHDEQPDVTRISDAPETEISLALAGTSGTALRHYLRARGHDQPHLAIFMWEDTDRSAVNRRRRRALAVLEKLGAVRLPAQTARAWEHGRFSAPYLRDELMSEGIFVETLETATTWSNLEHLYTEVRTSLQDALTAIGTPGVVECHISHVYHSGASLYFTVIAGEADDTLVQWRHLKTEASVAIVRSGGTITHHHAVGRDHAPYLEEEIGSLGIRILRAIKNELDPKNILNPGALVNVEK